MNIEQGNTHNRGGGEKQSQPLGAAEDTTKNLGTKVGDKKKKKR